MTGALDHSFPLMSDLSRRPPFAVPVEEQLAELDEEIAHRRALYARLTARHVITQGEADRLAAIARAVRADLGSHQSSTLVGSLAGQWDRSVTWDAKVRELRRELAERRQAWPKRVASAAHPLDADTAARRMERLEAVHFAYWIKLDWWDGGGVAEIRALAEERYAWELAQHRAGNPAARAFLTNAEHVALQERSKAA
jgi:hypothetical protein